MIVIIDGNHIDRSKPFIVDKVIDRHKKLIDLLILKGLMTKEQAIDL